MRERVYGTFLETRYGRRKAVIILTVLYCIGCYALLRSDLRYADDQGRIAFGYLGFRTSGRYASALFAPFVNMSTYLTDISPLSQILALFLCAIAAVLTASKVFSRNRLSLLDIIALIPFGLSPYFMGCLSFRFDAPYMALSVLFSCIPVLVVERKTWDFYAVTIVGVLISAMTYQASLGIYPMVILILLLHLSMREERREVIGGIFKRAVIAYAIAILIYIVILIIIGDNPFTDTEGMITVPLAIEHYRTYFSLLQSDFPLPWRLLFLCVAVMAWITCIRKGHGTNVVGRVLAPLGMMVLVFICSFGLCPYFLGDSIFQARCMYGVGIYMTLIALLVTTNLEPGVTDRLDRCLMVVGMLSVCAVSWICMVFASSYGNALQEQNYYIEKRLTALIDDLKDCDVLTGDQLVNVQITGSIGLSPILTNGGDQVANRQGHSYAWLISDERYDLELIKRLMPEYLSDSKDLWADMLLYYYADLPIERHYDSDLESENLPILVDNVYETIRGDENNLLVELKRYDLHLSMQ